MRKVVVFGGSGFLGSHVADTLTEAGYKVKIFDICSSAYLQSSQEMMVGDILDEKQVDRAVAGCDIVYNFAGIADIDASAREPLKTIKANILGNAIILEACRKAKVKRFVYASSLYVYSKTGAFYRGTKQACELLIENYNEVFGLPYTILRYGSLYGPRADENNFIHKTLKQALRNGKITRNGDGEELREYIHALDAARGSVEILSREFENQYIIITGNQQMKVKDLLLMIKEIFDNRIQVEYKKAASGSHYEITPYTFIPKIAQRIVHGPYLDLGQGLLQLIHGFYSELNPLSVCDRGPVPKRLPKKKR
ncbi:MAG: NAD(P)-dependent oxidoreductase [Candidatus Omnitrophota bacterium]